MKESILDRKELNKRAQEVFILDEGDYIWGGYVTTDKEVIVDMEEIDDEGDTVKFDYEPDMSGRPQALDYLLGKRDDFND